MSEALKDISASNKLEFYYSVENIKNQDLVNNIANCYKNGSGAKAFTLIELFNLIYYQEKFLISNLDNPQHVVKTLIALPLSALQRHVLFFNIIWWFGGVYNMNPKLRHCLWLIEEEFKKYKINTPEKDLYFKNKDEFEKLTVKELKELKIKFDKLSYPEKLLFWEKTFGSEYAIDISSRGFYTEDEIEKQGPYEMINPDCAFSIYPKDKTETELHNFWLLSHIQKNTSTQNCNIEFLKENYFNKIRNNPRAIEYTEMAIESINRQKEKEKKLKDEKRQMSLWGYYFGYQSVVIQEQPYLQLEASDFKGICIPCAKGIADAHFLNFLENQLKKLKSGEKELSQKNISLPQRIDTTVVNGKKFYRAKDYRDLIKEILELDPLLEVKDFLDFHYSQAGFTPGMSRLNWYTKFRKALFDYGFSDAKDRVKDLPNQIRTAFAWERENSFNYVISRQKVLNDTNKPIEKQKTQQKPDMFDYSNKENYILPDKLDAFKKIELELLNRRFINNSGEWIETKNKLCALIHLLHIKYLRKALPKKGVWASLLCYRRFFEHRYSIDIRKAFQQNQFPIASAKEYIPDYKFIIPTEDL